MNTAGVRLGPTVVAIPARNEVGRIRICLNALLDQRGPDGRPLPADDLRILVLANNCTDETAQAARSRSSRVSVQEVSFPPAHANAGAARRAAMEAAVSLAPMGARALLCTTDADSRPRPDWISRLWEALDGGAEAVAGAVEFEPGEAMSGRFSDRRRAEGLYSALQAEIIARSDPEPHNPWPNHIWAWGANLAVTTSAYRRVGGLPPRPLAEDRAFVDQLRRHDVPVRHCLEARVWTSARRNGRAPGGLASLIDDHLGHDAAPCDAALEPAFLVRRRAAWRERARRVFRGDLHHGCLSGGLRVPEEMVRQALCERTFGAGWSMMEAASPRLRPRRLRLDQLPSEISRAERLLHRIAAPVDPAGRARAATAGLWSA